MELGAFVVIRDLGICATQICLAPEVARIL